MSIPKNPTQRKWFKWYHLYYFLAAFDVLTISVSLYLNHTVLGIYSASVEENSVWSNRVSQYAKLNELAAACYNRDIASLDRFQARPIWEM
jgi:two-component system NtrC family sensor kinase